MNEKLLKEVELKIEQILSEGIQSENLNYLDKLVDIHKDLKNEEYWEKKKEEKEKKKKE